MSAIGKNIKKLRKFHKLNQTEFANNFGLSRANIGSYEEERAEPKIDVVIKIARLYRIDLEIILTKEIKINDLVNLHQEIHTDHLKESNDQQLDNNKILYIKQDQNINYIQNFQKSNFLQNLNTLRLPIPENIQSRGFQISDNQCLLKNYKHHDDDIFVVSSVNKKFIDKIPQDDQYVLVTTKGIYATEILLQNQDLILSKNNKIQNIISNKELLEAWRVIGIYKTEFMDHHIPHLNDAQKLIDLEQRITKLEQKS